MDQGNSVTDLDLRCGFCGGPVRLRSTVEPEGDAGCAACDNWAKNDEVIALALEAAGDHAPPEASTGNAPRRFVPAPLKR